MRSVIILLIGLLSLTGGTPQYWIDQAIEYQYSLVRDLPLNEVPFIKSHYTFDQPNLNFSGPITQRRQTSFQYQNQSTADQLDLGARFVEYRLHWINQNLLACIGSISTYNECFNNSTSTLQSRKWCSLVGLLNYGPNTGCSLSWDRTWRSHLQDISSWLNANTDEFVWIEVEWMVTSNTDINAAQTTMLSGITSTFDQAKILSPSDKIGAWPSLNSLNLLGKRVGIVCNSSSCPSSPLLWNTLESSVYPSDQYLTHQVAGFIPYNCSQEISSGTSFVPPQDDFYYFEEYSVQGAPINFTDVYTESLAQEVSSCGYLLKFDLISPSKMEWAVWSWAEGEPSLPVSGTPSKPSDACVYINVSTGRWFSTRCDSQKYPFSCQNTNNPNSWTFTTAAFGYETPPSCPNGYNLTYPITAEQNSNLVQAASGNIWIPAPSSDAALPLTPLPPTWDDLLPPETVYHSIWANLSQAKTPRFCAMSADAVNFTCNLEEYAELVGSRMGGDIVLAVFAGVYFLVIFGLAGYCCKQEYEKLKHFDEDGESLLADDDDMVERGGRYRDHIMCQALFLIPFFILVIGLGLTWSSNITYNSVSGQSSEELIDRLSLLTTTEEIVKDTISLLEATTVPVGEIQNLSSSMESGIDELSTNINFFLDTMNAVSMTRNALVIFLGIAPVVFAIMGCIFLKGSHFRSLLVIIIILDILVLMTVAIVLLHNNIGIITGDVCSELDYQNSMYQMWESPAAAAVAQLSVITRNAIINVANTTCSSWFAMCSYEYQVCSNFDCLPNTIMNLTNVTYIVDTDGSLEPIPLCQTSCQDPDLRGASELFMLNYNTYVAVDNRWASMEVMQKSIYSADDYDWLKVIFCQDYPSVTKSVNAACAVVVVGEILTTAFFFRFAW